MFFPIFSLDSPCCDMTLTKINMLCISWLRVEKAWRSPCDSCELVNFLFMIALSLLRDLLTFHDFIMLLLLHPMTFRCLDLWRRLMKRSVGRFSFSSPSFMKLLLSLWFGFNFDLLTPTFPFCVDSFGLVAKRWIEGGERKEFQLSHHSIS